MSETTRDLFLYGGLAVGAYFIVKSLTEPLVKPITAASDLLTTGINAVEQIPQTALYTGRQATKNLYDSYAGDYKTVSSGISASKTIFTTPSQNLASSAAVKVMGMSPSTAQSFYKSIQNPMLASSVTTQSQKVTNAIKTTAKYSSPVYTIGKGIKAVGSAVIKGATGIFKGATVTAGSKKK